MRQLVQLLVNGVVAGTIVAVTAAGLSLVTSTLRIVNLAHGDYLTFGAFAGFVANVSLGLQIVPATLIAIAATMAFGVILELALWRPLRRRGAGIGGLILVSFALALVLRNAFLLVWGPEPRRYAVDVFQVYDFGFFRLSLIQGLTVVLAVAAVVILAFVLLQTSVGKQMRATSDSRELAAITGIDVGRTAAFTWALGAGVAGLGGVLQGLVQGSFNPNMGVGLLLPIFAAVVLGGLGNPFGALAGGLVLGLVMELSTWDALAGGLAAVYKPVVAFGVLLVALLLKPHGIVGRAYLR